jgi:hypothetical protein
MRVPAFGGTVVAVLADMPSNGGADFADLTTEWFRQGEELEKPPPAPLHVADEPTRPWARYVIGFAALFALVGVIATLSARM